MFRQQLLEVRDAVNSFYDNIDIFTKKMEEKEGETDEPPYERMRKEEYHLKAALSIYNEAVLKFLVIHDADITVYEDMGPSVREIWNNVGAAIDLQCDPYEELSAAAKKTGDNKDYNQKCGTGIWKDLGLTRQNFPGIKRHEKDTSETH